MKNRIIITRLMKSTIAIAMIMVMGSCSQKTASDADQLRTQISEYNQQVVEINQKIAALELQLEEMGEVMHNRERTPVAISIMEPQTFDHLFRVNARVEAVKEATISPEINGHIQEISVVKGQHVKAGQVLARLNTSVLESSIAEIKTSMDLAETVFARQQRLWEQQIGSEMQYLEAKNRYESLKSRLQTTQSQINMAIIRSPINGVVDEIWVKQGELAMPGARLMQVINLEQLNINADISETFLPMIQPTDSVILRFGAFPDFEQVVPIHRLGNVINPENRTFRVQVRINNRNEMFKPNMMASMSIRTYQAGDALVVPSIMIKQDTQGYFVFIADKNSAGDLVARKIYIERGMTGEGRTMITSGLQPGDRLITQGHNRVIDGTLIRAD
jgi:membrane fusion protein, multidrug efflux system